MSNCPLCNLDATPAKAERTAGLFRRAWRGTQWLFPATVLVLIPKCPFCVMAYVALFTGIGISVTTARWIQILLLVLCLTSLGSLAQRYWRRRAGT
jgi:hypothetical protein